MPAGVVRSSKKPTILRSLAASGGTGRFSFCGVDGRRFQL
jgi:hypothetical protein